MNVQSRIRSGIRRRLRWVRRPLVNWIASIGSARAGIASIYYALFSTAFSREHRAILFGKKRFRELIANPTSSSSLLRRNIHRLEKGLISRPRRDVFAVDYINETVDVYERALKSCDCAGTSELAWARDVLRRYFVVTGSHPLLDQVRKRFAAFPDVNWTVAPDRYGERIPYCREQGASPVEFDSLVALAKRRRSVRWFEQKPVPRELLLKAAEVATQSPSACNRQPFQFRVFDDSELLQKVAALPAGTAGYSQNFPCIIVVVGQQRYYFDERDRHLIYIDGSLATMAFVLALETLGLSSCCINWPDIEEREQIAANLLGLEPDERPVMFIAVGYPESNGLVPYSEKRPPEELCRFNFE